MSRYFQSTLAILGATVALSVIACTGPAPTPTLGPNATADAVLDAARQAMARVDTFRWESDLEAVPDTSPSRVRVEGTWVGGNVDVTSTNLSNPTFESRKMYIDGLSLVLRDGEWKERPFFDPTGVPAWGDHPLIRPMDESTVTVDGANYRVVGTQHIDLTEPDGFIDLSYALLIDRGTLRLASSTIEASLSEGEAMVQTTSFTAYDEPASIGGPAQYVPLPTIDGARPDATPTPTRTPMR